MEKEMHVTLPYMQYRELIELVRKEAHSQWLDKELQNPLVKSQNKETTSLPIYHFSPSSWGVGFKAPHLKCF